jgi:hypothetical protein
MLIGLGPVGCPWTRLPEEYRPFFRLPLEEQRVELRRLPVEEQLNVYVAGITHLHPPRMDLGIVIGEQGAAVLPALVERVRSEPDEYVKANLTRILIAMPCTPEAQSKIINAIGTFRAELSTMKDSLWRDIGEKDLQAAEGRCTDGSGDAVNVIRSRGHLVRR